MSNKKRIAIDAMGGDGGVALTIPAALHALEITHELFLYLVGNSAQIEPLLSEIPDSLSARLVIVHAEQSIDDSDAPGNILRNGKESSMYRAVELVKSGEVQAMVSAGNTGALLMIGRHLLKTILGIQKPALMASIPGISQCSYLLDVGANPKCNAQQLFEFALMGSAFAASINGSAKVALLNIGSEEYKGTLEVRAASLFMERCEQLDFVGFIEPSQVFDGEVDVVICDGFVGNVMIKSAAGVANVVNGLLAAQYNASSVELKDNASAARLSKAINPQRFNGASLLGLQGSIIKSHGNATMEGFAYAIIRAVQEVESAASQLIAEKVAAMIELN